MSFQIPVKSEPSVAEELLGKILARLESIDGKLDVLGAFIAEKQLTPTKKEELVESPKKPVEQTPLKPQTFNGDFTEDEVNGLKWKEAKVFFWVYKRNEDGSQDKTRESLMRFLTEKRAFIEDKDVGAVLWGRKYTMNRSGNFIQRWKQYE